MQVENIVSEPFADISDENKTEELVDEFKENVYKKLNSREKWFLYGPVVYKDNHIKQQLVKRNPDYIVTVEKLLVAKPTNLDGIKRTAKWIMTLLLQAFGYLLVPAAVVALSFVVVGEMVAGRDFSIRSPDGAMFDIDASWFAPDMDGSIFSSVGTVHVVIDGVAFPPWPTLEGVTFPELDGSFVFTGGRFFRVPSERIDALRAMVSTASTWVEAARASAVAAHDALRKSAFGLPSWLTGVDYTSLKATSAKMVLILIAGPLTFILGVTATVSAATLPSVLLVLQPLLVAMDLLIDTYNEIYPLDEFSRYYKQRMHRVWDNYKEVIGIIPQSVVENVKAMVAAVS